MDLWGDRGLGGNSIRGVYAVLNVVEGVRGPGVWTIDRG